jgi:polysaccharide biosynthesis PFTS motif protein
LNNFYLFKDLVSGFGVVNRWKRSRLRCVMRGYRLLKKDGNLSLIPTIQSELTEHPLGIDRNRFASVIFGAANGVEELVVRQYLLLRIGGMSLNAALLRALALPNAKIVYPMPAQWRSVLETHGFRLSHWRCELLWILYTAAAWGYGLVQIGRVLLGAITSRSDRALPRERHVYFVGLSRGNLPQRKGGVSSHDIVSWYLKWDGRDRKAASVRHSVAGSGTLEVDGVCISAQSGPLPSLSDVRSVFLYLTWGVMAALSALVSLLRGRWWDALLLNQAALRAQVEVSPADLLAREYFFHNSGWLYRPLWTYELDSKQSQATLYFYSTNCELFKTQLGYPVPLYGYQAMNWPRYLVWNEHQTDFLKRVTGKSVNSIEVGPIWFSSNTKPVEQQGGQCIALFDVTPFRRLRFCQLGLNVEFYTPEVANAFVRDVTEVANQFGAEVLWKRKRNVGKLAHPKYRGFVESLNYENGVRLVDPDTSAIRVIQASQVVVSMPFTSTALIAKSLGIPSVYYDPSGIVQRDDRAAHGIEILIGRNQLERWMRQSLFSDVLN